MNLENSVECTKKFRKHYVPYIHAKGQGNWSCLEGLSGFVYWASQNRRKFSEEIVGKVQSCLLVPDKPEAVKQRGPPGLFYLENILSLSPLFKEHFTLYHWRKAWC